MATLRDRPYAQFNFLVDLGTGSTESPQAGFQECGEIGMSVDVVEYRNGNEKENGVRKLTGLARYPDVTLKRGVIGSLDLYSWLDDIRNGNETAYRTVTVQLMNEDHSAVVAGVEAAARADRQARERPARRAAQRRGDGGARRSRTSGSRWSSSAYPTSGGTRSPRSRAPGRAASGASAAAA